MGGTMKTDKELAKIRLEFKRCKIWDKRCIKSLMKISINLINNLGQSFSSACGKCLRQCGSRIFSDNRMTVEKIQAGHLEETLKRIKKEKVLLIPQDTTFVDYTSHRSTEGLGHIGSTGKNYGLAVHTSMIISEEGLSFGILNQKIWTRDPATFGKKHQRKDKPIEEKESSKWLDPIDIIDKKIPLDKHEIWIIGDRESDIYEYMIKPRHKNCHLLIRACQSRNMYKSEGDTPTSLFSYIETLAIQANRQVEISRENRTETIDLVVSYDNINILRSKSSKSKPESVRMGVVYARELEERKDTKGKAKDAIKWVLLVDKHIEDIQTAIKYLDYYTQRWKIERFHYTLKQGMKIEKLQFDDAKTLSNVIAFYSVLAWFTQWITYIGRVKPNMPAKEVTDELSIEVLTAFMKKKINSAYEVMIAIGVLGGFIGGSKRYPYPGLKSMWQGITKLFFLKQGWLLAKSQLSDIYTT